MEAVAYRDLMSDVSHEGGELRALTRPSRAREVADGLVEQIAEGRWQPGDQLPPESVLAQQLGVSRSSVREAIHRLQAQGLVRVVHGRGTYVLEARPSLLVPDGIVDLIARSPDHVDEVHEARLVLELGIVELAAERADERDLAELRDLVSEGRRLLAHGLATHETEAFELGLRFHLRLADAARSPLLGGLYGVLVEPLRRTSQYRQRSRPNPHEELDFHEAIVDAIERKDTAAAVALMREHVEHTAALVVRPGPEPDAAA
jgi:GntR family transcriptional regulator, transcriptional repressor for pyruvate dehydrogenase complex